VGKRTEKVSGSGVRRTVAPERVSVRFHSRIVDFKLASQLVTEPKDDGLWILVRNAVGRPAFLKDLAGLAEARSALAGLPRRSKQSGGGIRRSGRIHRQD
jgi:hypothetical protein